MSCQLTCACVWIRAAVADAQEKSAGEAMAKVKVILQKVYASLGEEFVDGEEFDGAVVREPTPPLLTLGRTALLPRLNILVGHAQMLKRLRFCVGARCDQAIHPARDEELSEPANGRQRMNSWYRSDASRLHYPTHARTQIQTTASRRHFFIGGGPPPFFFAMGGGWVGHFRG